jgi:hypothetical protein
VAFRKVSNRTLSPNLWYVAFLSFARRHCLHPLNFSFPGCLPGCLSQSARQDLYASKIQSYLFTFGEEVRKKIMISRFIDDYNYNMGVVNIANQYRESYETHRKTWRNWICIFTWIIDQAITNSYRLTRLYQTIQGLKRWKITTTKAWRESLWQHLLPYSNHPSIRSRVVRSEKIPIVRLNAGLNHQWYKRAKRTGCIQCRVAIAHKKRMKIERARQTEYGCTIRKVALCRRGTCWQAFHGLNSS